MNTIHDPQHDSDFHKKKNKKRSGPVIALKVFRFAARLVRENRLTQIASSLTFTTVLALVPLLAVVLALFTAFPLFGEFRLALENFMASNLMPATISENVMASLNQFAAQASRLTAIGSLFLVVTSIMLMMTIDEAFNEIWHVAQQRPMRRRIMVYWVILSLGPILVGASLWATSLMAKISLHHVGESSALGSFTLSLVPLAITGLGFAALFVHVPNRHVYWKDALAGGFGSAIALAIMKAGFAFYLTRFPSYTVIYGAFATVPIFLLWIYLSWLAILFGATVAATLPLLRLRRWDENRHRGAAFIDSVNIIRLLQRARQSSPPGRSTQFLNTHLKLHYDELLTALTTLQELGYIVHVQEKGSERWVLACDLQQAGLGPIIDSLLIDRNQPGFLEDRVLVQAVSSCLTQSGAVTLEDAIKSDEALPETPVVVQNMNKLP
jgi:Predicted membrane protein